MGNWLDIKKNTILFSLDFFMLNSLESYTVTTYTCYHFCVSISKIYILIVFREGENINQTVMLNQKILNLKFWSSTIWKDVFLEMLECLYNKECMLCVF